MNTVVDDSAFARATPAKPGFMRRALRQPLLQFLVVGTAIFIASALLDHVRSSSEQNIVVDTARTQRIAELYRVQMGALPSAADLDYLVDSHVRDEILYREALKMGLDREDEIIRRRLIQKLEFLHNDLATIPEPTDADLRQYYVKHSDRFATSASATFTHIYFSADAVGEDGAKRAAELQLAQLDSSGEVSAARLGDPFPLQHSYAQIEEQETAQIFGRTPFTQAIFSAPEQRWSGPFRSGYGWHLVWVARRVPSKVMDFATARERIREAYIASAKRDANERSYAALKANYRVLHTTDENAK